MPVVWRGLEILENLYMKLAGAVGFEPTVHDTKNRCLTTWLRPNKLMNNQ